jgi:hypothetical protein
MRPVVGVGVEQAEQLRAREYVLKLQCQFVDDVLEQTPFASQHPLDALLHGLLARVRAPEAIG